jgi:hypothetical protein
MDRLDILETIQIGDAFLIRFNCPLCNGQNLNDWKNLTCQCCRKACGVYFEFENSKKKFRCVAGTVRKNVRYRKATIRTLMEIQQNLCAYCDTILNHFHIDHVVPLSFGGTNNIGNLVLACETCNLRVGSKVFQSFELKKQFILKLRQLN